MRQQDRILAALAAARVPLTGPELFAALFADRSDGGPSSGYRIVSVLIHRLRRAGAPILTVRGGYVLAGSHAHAAVLAAAERERIVVARRTTPEERVVAVLSAADRPLRLKPLSAFAQADDSTVKRLIPQLRARGVPIVTVPGLAGGYLLAQVSP